MTPRPLIDGLGAAAAQVPRWAVTMMVLFVAGCGRRDTAVQIGNREQVLHRGAGSELSILDPHRNPGQQEGIVIAELFDALVVANPANVHELLPKAAERWEVSPDALTYRFYLRRDAKWSNGDPVVAEDYRSSFLRLIEPAFAAPHAPDADMIVGAEDYRRGRLTEPAKVGLSTEGDFIFQVRLRAPSPVFLYQMGHYPFLALHRASIEANGGWLNPRADWTRPGKMVASGPFTLGELRSDVVVLKKNPRYWDAARVGLKEIRSYPFGSMDTEERAFRAGQLHVTANVPLARIDTYRAAKPAILRESATIGLQYLMFNTRKPPLNDPRVRRALALAIDRQLIAEKVLNGTSPAAYSFGQPGMGGYHPREQLREDAAEARALLAQAGYPHGAGFPPLTYLFNSLERNREIAEALQEMWNRDLGIEVRLFNQEWKVFLATRKAGDFHIARAAMVPIVPECVTLYELLGAEHVNNDTGWSSPGYSELLSRAASTMSREERFSLYHRLERILLEETPATPLVYWSSAQLVHPAVRNWPTNIRNTRELSRVWLAPGEPL